MGVPALRIPLSLSMEEFERNTKQAQERVSDTLQTIGRKFADANSHLMAAGEDAASSVALSWSRASARMLLKTAGAVAGMVVAFELVGSVVGAVRRQIADMIEVAERASSLGVAPTFLQQWRSEAQGLRVDVDDLDDALNTAFRATREKSPIDVAEWETAGERITDVEKALRVYNEAIAKSAGTRLEGLVLFRDAQSQDEKVRAVLVAMEELNRLGQQAAALDLGERMFGTKFVDNIRLGKTSAEAMLRNLDDMSKIEFSDALVRRAKEVDENLQRAYQRLDKELKPSWDGLAEKALAIRDLWADIVRWIGEAVAVANKFGVTPQSKIDAKKAQLANVQTLLDSGPAFFGFEQRSREALRDKLKAEIAALEKQAAEHAPRDSFAARFGTWGSRGEGAAPTRKASDQTTAPARDALDRALDQTEKRIAAMEAEAGAIDLTTAARERAKLVAELETIAKQANTAAGRESAEVTAEQRAKIEAMADAYGRVAQRIEEARSPLATFARESANVADALNRFAASGLGTVTDELAAMALGTRSAADAFRIMTQSILSDLLKIAIRSSVTGPLADVFKGLFASSGVFGLTGKASGGWVDGPGTSTSDSIPARLSRGEYVVRAASARRFGPLLEAINSGGVARFAAGGPVGGMPAFQLPAVAGAHPRPQYNVTVNNSAPGAQVSASPGRDGGLTIDIEAMVDRALASRISSGRSATGRAAGLRPSLIG
ncbi:hypothetical protein RHODGE_RHODGE_02834 [Rhodoplanes serenus]|uniref:Bacteriophage tail tape measure C-terminal domain-containing protein n=1 Tax=Rhodoplanes serenus TaxID=200615 RepID=A0A3S4CI02_9BRAD|nr:phage tail tape measure C-terminal domain-containing protein [Rhodoplanes serenus]VCU09665.1 hypothetical protein RHODGE_RHODGE_02834 [Rhodoplanes serenus]